MRTVVKFFHFYSDKSGKVLYSLESRGMDSLADKWKKLSLTEVEGLQIIFNDELIEVQVKKGDSCIVGKLHMECIIKKEVMQTTMSKIWRTFKPFLFVDINPNTFIIKFEDLADMNRVM